MKSTATFLAAALLAASTALDATAQGITLGASTKTNVTYTSQSKENRARIRHLVLERGDGALFDKTGTFAEAADIAALHEVTEHISEIEDAWSEGFARGYAELQSALANLPTNGVTLGLRFPLNPEGRDRLDIYVATNYYDRTNNQDHLWVWFSKEVALKPTMVIPYIYNGGFTTNRVTGTWKNWGNSNEVMTVRSKVGDQDFVYTGCKELIVQRPPEIQGVLADLNPHGRFGSGQDGVNWGSMILSLNGNITHTGEITNTLITATHPVPTYIKTNNGGIVGTTNAEFTVSFPLVTVGDGYILAKFWLDGGNVRLALSAFGTTPPVSVPLRYRAAETDAWTLAGAAARTGTANNLSEYAIAMPSGASETTLWCVGTPPAVEGE